MLGREDIPLDTEGEAQALRLGARFAADRPTVVYSSPLGRARQTAAAIPALQPGVRDAPGLEELHVGALEGLTGPELDTRFPGLMKIWLHQPLDFRPPDGETLGEASERAWSGLEAVVAAERSAATLVVVTHQIVLGALLCRIQGRPLSEFRSFFHKNTAITELEWDDSPRVLRLADASHLG